MKKYTKANRRTMAIIRHMRRSAISAGRPGGLIREITWKAGRLEVICEWAEFYTQNEAIGTLQLAGNALMPI